MIDRSTARAQILVLAGFALLGAWNIFDAHGPASRYLSAVMVAVCTFAAAWKFLRYRQRHRAVR